MKMHLSVERRSDPMQSFRHYEVGDPVIHRGWAYKGVVVQVPKKQHHLSHLGVQWANGKEQDVWIPALMVDPEHIEKKVISMGYWVPKKGDRIKVTKTKAKGTVDYVDVQNLPYSVYRPVQVLLDKPYDESGQRMRRYGIEELKKLKPKDNKPPDDEVLDENEVFSWDLDEDEAIVW